MISPSVPCGIMDQFISVMGRDEPSAAASTAVRAKHRTRADERRRRIELLIINTNVRHELAGGEYAQRRAQCRDRCEKFSACRLCATRRAETLKSAKGQNGRNRFTAAPVMSSAKSSAPFMPPEGVRASDWPERRPVYVCQPRFIARRLRSELQRTRCGGGNCRRHWQQRRDLWLSHDRRRLWRLRGGIGENRTRRSHLPNRSPPITK